MSPPNFLKESPLDQGIPIELNPSHSKSSSEKRWLSSRYNIRAKTADGSLLLWNTYSGSMNIFKPELAPKIKPLLSRKGVQGTEEGVIAYLAKRGYLVPESSDEFLRVQKAFGDQQYRTDIFELILMASEDCNFRCKYCYEKFLRGTMRPEVRQGVKNMLLKRVPSLTRLNVEWFGGEPLYGRRAIEDLAPFLQKTALENDLQFFSSMTTNGYLLTEDVADRLLDWGIKTYQITLDGPPEIHDCMRPTRDGNGTFETILENLKSMARRDQEFHITIRVNYDNTNYPLMNGFLEQLSHHFGGDERFYLSFHAVGRWGGENDDQLDVCGEKTSILALREMRREASKRGLSVSTLKQVRFGGAVCYAARPYNFVIGADGKIMKCTIVLDNQENNIVGHLQEDGEYKLHEDHMALWTEPAFQRDEQCQKCTVLPLCQGVHCPLIRINQDRSPCISLRTEAKRELAQTIELQSLKVEFERKMGKNMQVPV